MKTFKGQADEAIGDLKICINYDRESTIICITRIQVLIDTGKYFAGFLYPLNNDTDEIENNIITDEIDIIYKSITKLKEAIK